MRHAPLLTIRLVLLPSRVGPATQQSTTGASGHVTVTSEMIFMLGWPPGWRGEPWPLPPRPQQLPLHMFWFFGYLLLSVLMQPKRAVLGGVAGPVEVAGGTLARLECRLIGSRVLGEVQTLGAEECLTPLLCLFHRVPSLQPVAESDERSLTCDCVSESGAEAGQGHVSSPGGVVLNMGPGWDRTPLLTLPLFSLPAAAPQGSALLTLL